MALSEKGKGELYIISEAFLGGLFPIITVLSFSAVSAAASFEWSTAFAALFFAAMLTYRRRWRELGDPLVWKYSFYIALFIVVLFYGCYFLGLRSTTPGNAAIIVMFQVFTTTVFFRLLRKETFLPHQSLGAILMVIGTLVVLAPNFAGFKAGDLLIVLGTFFAPAGNYFQQRARTIASSETILFLRNLLSLPLIAVLGYWMHMGLTTGVQTALLPILINGIALLGFAKIFWLEGIHRITVSKAIALETLSPLVTLLFAWLLLSQVPTLWQLLALAPFSLGVLLLTDQIRLKT
jgi:drug/metabolite transporter (DMT)-like permease